MQSSLLEQAVSGAARKNPDQAAEHVRAVGFSNDLARRATETIEQERALGAAFEE